MMRKVVLSRLLIDPWVAWLVTMPLLALVFLTTMQYQRVEADMAQNPAKAAAMFGAPAAVGNARVFNDHQDSGIVGRLFGEGKIAATADNGYPIAAQQQLTGTMTFMPWAYPPPLTAAAMILRRPQRMTIVPETRSGLDSKVVS